MPLTLHLDQGFLHIFSCCCSSCFLLLLLQACIWDFGHSALIFTNSYSPHLSVCVVQPGSKQFFFFFAGFTRSGSYNQKTISIALMLLIVNFVGQISHVQTYVCMYVLSWSMYGVIPWELKKKSQTFLDNNNKFLLFPIVFGTFNCPFCMCNLF